MSSVLEFVSDFISDFSPGNFTSPLQVDFYNYLLKIKGEHSMASRGDIKPEDIVDILPMIILYDKIEDDYVVRLMGTICAEVLGEATGKKLTSSPAGSDAIERFNWCAHNKKPYYHIKPLDKFNKIHANSSEIVMPLSNNDFDVNMIILAHHFY